jgi:hypothetical protein
MRLWTKCVQTITPSRDQARSHQSDADVRQHRHIESARKEARKMAINGLVLVIAQPPQPAAA